MAPLVPRGMLRTSIILPDPAGFTDTSQEQMNASHFDGFMNTLGEDGERGERICCFRRDPPSTSHGSTHPLLTAFLPASHRLRAPGTETESP